MKKEIRIEMQNILTAHDIKECSGCELCDLAIRYGSVLHETTDDKYILKKDGEIIGRFPSKKKMARFLKKQNYFIQELVDGFNLSGYEVEIAKNRI